MSEPLEVPLPPRPKRLNRLALVAVLVVFGVALVAVFLTLKPPQRAKAALDTSDPSAPARPGFLERAPAAPAPRPPVPAESPGYWQDALGGVRHSEAGPGSADARELDGAMSAAGEGPGEGPRPAAERTASVPVNPRLEAYRQALRAPVTPRTAGADAAPAAGESEGAGAPRPPVFPAAFALTGPPREAPPAEAGPSPPGVASTGGGAGPGRADHQGFLHSAEALAPRELKVRRDDAAAGLVLEAGTVIPAALVTAVNSDVAGPLVAQVTGDVYDRKQRMVLIPRGSRLVGEYDSQVALGERRLLVAWSRVIFPDGSGLSFPGLPAATKSGEAGLAASVNNHMARVFGSALLLSIVSAGAQLSQPQESAVLGTAASTRQIAAAAVGQQLSSVAVELLRRQMSVPPTLRIAFGTSFYVFVKGDIDFEDSYRN